MEKTRLRIRFTKTADLRWISHRDLARLWERLLRRAGLEMAFSEGFHPKPRISFPSALALGIEALDEIVELEVVGSVDLETTMHSIRREMPVGMELISLESPGYALGKARVVGATYRIRAPESELDRLGQRIEQICSSNDIEIQREKRTVRCAIDDPQFDLRLEGQDLVFALPVTAEGSLRPAELLEYLGLSALLESGAVLQRTAVQLQGPED